MLEKRKERRMFRRERRVGWRERGGGHGLLREGEREERKEERKGGRDALSFHATQRRGSL